MGTFLNNFTSLANWHWGETAVAAVFVLVAVLTMRSVAEREGAMSLGRGKQDPEARRASYEARWRNQSLPGA